MKKNYSALVVLMFFFIVRPIQAQYNFSVTQCTDSSEVVALINSILLGNVEPVFKKNISFQGDPGAVGYYTGGELFGFSETSGISLSTGFSGTLDNSNTCSSGNANGNTTGGADDDLMFMSSSPIYDACVIEFDLMLSNDSVFLKYIFGSEEYHDWVNSGFNDRFGFFLSGPGINGPYSYNAKNIAVVPGTSTEVSVSTINCGNQQFFCNPPPGNGPNCNLLYDNTNSSQNSFSECVLDAYTVPFTTEQEVQSFQWYHFKLAIGDAVDAAYDSGVLLEKGSIVSIPVPEIDIVECESEPEIIEYIDNVLLSNVFEENKANITFTGDPKSIGYFSNTEFLQLEQNNGIAMTTGYAGNVAIPNICDKSANASTNNNGLNSDPDLELIAGGEIRDAGIIEFDYRPSSDTINLEYVFASEEYHEMVNVGYFDVFGVFLSGPGIEGGFSNNAVNIATVPTENLPVNTNTINFGAGGKTCAGKPDSCLNCQYLIDNSQTSDTAFFALAYDGYTVPMNASYNVTAGEWYHLKIAIADGLTEQFDSGIFLSGGTLVSDSITTSLNENLFGRNIQIRPNPAKEYVEIHNSGKEPITEIAIFDVNGKLFRRQQFENGRISMAGMPKGVLLLEIKTNKNVGRFKLIHQ